MTTLHELIIQIGEDTDIFHEFVHGTSSGFTETESGPLMTLPEAEDQIQEAIASYTNINPRGEWATATNYEIKDIVYEELDSSSASGPTFYICLYAHTSGTFTTDYNSGYWAIWQNAYGGVITVPTLAALATTKAAYTGQVAYIKGRTSDGDGGQGFWVLTSGDFTTELAVDTLNGVYLEYSGEDGSTRAWVRQYVDKIYFEWFQTNTTPGTTDMSIGITAALSFGGIIQSLEDTIYATSGEHTVTDQKIFGENVTFKRLSSGIGAVFEVTGDGGLFGSITIDGNNLWGHGVTISTAVSGDATPSVSNRIKIINVGGTPSTTIITGATNANPCVVTAVGHGLSDGAIARIKNVTGLVSTSNPSNSIINGVFRITYISADTFSIPVNTTSWTAYSSGGTVEEASYGLTVENTSTGYAALAKTITGLTLKDNNGHIFINGSNYSTFDHIKMFGASPNYDIYINSLDNQQLEFSNIYMEGGICCHAYGVRDVYFDNIRAYWSATKNWTGSWLSAIGMNYGSGNAGGEIANIRINNLSLTRSVDNPTIPIFDINSYDFTVTKARIRDAVSTSWSVFRDRGTKRMRLQDITVESTNSWGLFHSSSTGGTNTIADGIWYTQGVKGTAVWTCLSVAGYLSGFTVVRNSNIDHELSTTGSARGFIFENIDGDVDLTNASGYGSYLYNISGTVTDPNKAATLAVNAAGDYLRMQISNTYADNAAATAGGLAAGDIYKTATGDVKVVY